MAGDHAPLRGDIWEFDLGDPIGHESGHRRPGVIASADRFNPFGLVTVLPITRTEKPYPTRVTVPPGDISGLHSTSYIQVEQIRTVSAERLTRRIGIAPGMKDVDRILRLLLDL